MEQTEAREKLDQAVRTISTAALLLRLEMPIMEAFLKEERDMDNFGHIMDPTLYRNPERRAVCALVSPLFKAAVQFVRLHDAQQTAAASDALAKVKR